MRRMPRERALTQPRLHKAAAPSLPLEGGVGPKRPIKPKALPRSEASAQPDLFDRTTMAATDEVVPTPPLHPKQTRPDRLTPQDAPLSTVDPRTLSPSTRPDGSLYIVTDAETARQWRQHGIPLNPHAPVALVERNALLPWIIQIAEANGDSETTLPTILKLRRTLAAGSLEHDPDQSIRLGASCYLLTGNGSSS